MEAWKGPEALSLQPGKEVNMFQCEMCLEEVDCGYLDSRNVCLRCASLLDKWEGGEEGATPDE